MESGGPVMLYHAEGGEASGLWSSLSIDLVRLWYLAIDQHAKQLTICLLDPRGQVAQRLQVSTKGEKVREYLRELKERCGREGGYVAILEVCGFNDWLIEVLRAEGCLEVVLVQPAKKDKRKNDHRDAYHLAALLWTNREQLVGGDRLWNVKRVYIPDAKQRSDRRVTGLRVSLGREQTRTINRIKHLLRRRNLQHDCPTKGIQSRRAKQWLSGLKLEELDRMEMDHLLARWKQLSEEIRAVEGRIVRQAAGSRFCEVLMSIPGAGEYTALGLVSRAVPIDRFAAKGSLANYWGLVPGLDDSGERTGNARSITKAGSAVARFLLGQLVVHVLKKDRRMRQWHRRVKHKRGAKIARVAVMRKLANIIQEMLQTGQAYRLEANPEKATAEDVDLGVDAKKKSEPGAEDKSKG